MKKKTMFCDHVYKVIGSEICPKCNKITNEVQWKLQHKLEKDWLKKNPDAWRNVGWWSI